MASVEIRQAETPNEIDSARKLFREYEAWLGMDLCFQAFEQEVENLPGKYAPHAGRLYLARCDGELAGCIALRSFADGICEMKRLFVRDGFRGKRVGLMLIEKLIEAARAEGYRALRLDTYPPKMGKAVTLYEAHGFVPISPYYDNPHEGVLFMELQL